MNTNHYLLKLIQEASDEYDVDLTEIETEAESVIDELEDAQDEIKDLKKEVDELLQEIEELESRPVAEFENVAFNNIVTQSAIETILRNIEYIPASELEEFANKYNRI